MIELINIDKSYGKQQVLHQFNIALQENEINCILGPSGCGKTTLLNIIAGLDQEYMGRIEGINHQTFSYIFQEARLLNWYTVEKNLKVVLKHDKDTDAIVEKYLKVVGLYDYKHYYPHQLSGGMKQRLSIARAFAYKSDILLMDEPFKGLDVALKKNLIQNFIDLWEEDKRTVIFVTHDIDEAILLGDDVYILNERPIQVVFNTSIEGHQKDRQVNQYNIKEKKKLIYHELTKDKEISNGNGWNTD